jgi:hypothetical protein
MSFSRFLSTLLPVFYTQTLFEDPIQGLAAFRFASPLMIGDGFRKILVQKRPLKSCAGSSASVGPASGAGRRGTGRAVTAIFGYGAWVHSGCLRRCF